MDKVKEQAHTDEQVSAGPLRAMLSAFSPLFSLLSSRELSGGMHEPHSNTNKKQINELIARTPEEIDLFNKMDEEERAREVKRGGGGGNGGRGVILGNSNGGGGGDGDNEEIDGEIAALLKQYNLKASDLPPGALALGAEKLSRFLASYANGVNKWLINSWPAWRDKMLADPDFAYKLFIEETVGTADCVITFCVPGELPLRVAAARPELIKSVVCSAVATDCSRCSRARPATPELPSMRGGRSTARCSSGWWS